MVTLNGKVEYPKNIAEELGKVVKTYSIEATELAEELGNVRVLNVVMLGAVVKAMGLEDIDFKQIIRETVKPKFVDLNLKAFELGLEQIK